MIIARELRIGNFVCTDYKETDGTIRKIEVALLALPNDGGFCFTEIRHHETGDIKYKECENSYPAHPYNNIHGIPLTEEWFVKFGAEPLYNNKHVYESQYHLEGYNITRNIGKPDFVIEIGADYENAFIKIGQYVHELQNFMYWVLEKKELELK